MKDTYRHPPAAARPAEQLSRLHHSADHVTAMAASPRFGGPPTGGSAIADDDSAIGCSSASPEPQVKVNGASPTISISDQEENFECLGEGSENDLSRSMGHCRSQSQPEVPIRRASWLRTSLRRASKDSASELPSSFRRYGSMRSNKRSGVTNGYGSPVYRTPSFNSSGRSSNCDGDDMYSDLSLEDDVNDLNHKVQVLERQVTLLADNQHNDDDRYTRSKQDNATLQARLIMMEEQLREAEMRAADQLDSEQRRHKELMQRIEREKVLEVENQQIRAQGLEKELRHAEAEASRCQQQLHQALAERAALDERLSELQSALESARLETARAAELERRGRQEREQERALQERLMAELAGELQETQRSAHLRLKTESDEAGRVRLQQDHLENEVRRLREENKELQEANDELQAQLLTTGLQEGRQLLDSGAKSLAAELGDMSGDQLLPTKVTNVFHQSFHLHHQLKQSLLEQQEVNKQLRNYIDGILLNIVENHPQLLEVKRSH
ncbi:rab11 family-interacting protein 4-like isoform X2 [Amphibalanus amphitrite]|uniref:rab11 family-interacting protein 4-like isoform X2 n=1 Tax=Amphibalanus amphitrite TaxID=1232801 RepID=UPI001C91680D|nr:rab11 family-interacting protein 4-like isoform X2 [Amphibalanus amphitrite]